MACYRLHVAGCTFRGADLRDGNLDGWNPGLQRRPGGRAPSGPSSRYDDCDFTRTRTGPYGSMGRAHFERCRFTNTDFPSPMWFRGASLKDCVFKGSFRTVCFGWTGLVDEPPPLLDGVDVTEAHFDSVEVYAVQGRGLITRPDQSG